jgi:hypothetical protein
MQKQFIKNIYQEFVYCDPEDHLLKPHNNLTKPERNCKSMCANCINNPNNKSSIMTIQSDITGHYGPAIAYGNNNSEIKQTFNLVGAAGAVFCDSPQIETLGDTPSDTDQGSSASRKKETKPKHIIYDEETFNQIELRGFITKDLLRQSLDKGSNLFHIAKDKFDDLHEKYHEFKEILHTLKTEFDNTLQCVIETGKEITKKINHIIYQLYLAVMNKKL